MSTLEARGVEIAWSKRGEGPAVLLIHETASTRAVWEPMSDALAPHARAISYDRRGWGDSSAPEGYRRTTVEEQSEDAVALLETAEAAPAVVVGAGLGAVIALDLLLRRPDLVAATVVVEPPLLQLLPAATEALSHDRRRLEMAAGAGQNVIELYLSGGLPALGAEVSRLPGEMTAEARERPASVIAEMGVAAGWATPLPRLAAAERSSAIVTSPSTPALLRGASVALADRLGEAAVSEIDAGAVAPHLGAPEEVAALALAVSR
jgi:pimeloyl-ACP methyl ester carboxylesterase